MTEQDENPTRPISVAELLARHGADGAPPPGGRRRRRRGNADAVTVAELTGEIPVVRADDTETAHRARPAESVAAAEPAESVAAAEPAAQPPVEATEATGDAGAGTDAAAGGDGAEEMSPDPLVDDDDDFFGSPIDLADPPETDYAAPAGTELFGGPTGTRGDTGPTEATDTETDAERAETGAGEPGDESDAAGTDETDGGDAESAADTGEPESRSRLAALGRGLLVVVQCIVAVAFGAGLFIGFDQLWRWNNIVALVLSVLVILGLVVGVRVVRKTEDIASTLIAVAVGALVTLGPLALLESN